MQPQEAYGQIAETCHYLGRAARSRLAAVLAESHIAHSVNPVFNSPVASPQFQQPSGTGLLRRQAGNGIGQLPACPPFVVADALHSAHLGHMGPVAVVGQLTEDP